MDQFALGKKLAMLRKEKKLTQTQLASQVMEIADNIGMITGVNVSSYESGNRTPTLERLIAFATFFDVSVDYLLGFDINPKPTTDKKNNENDKPFLEPDVLIPQNMLGKFHEQPVFVVCPDTVMHNRWAILDYFNKQLLFLNEIYPITESTKLYSSVPLSSAYASLNLPRPLSINQLLNNNDLFWVETLSSDAQVKGEYNGWYRHNENMTMLVNCANGLTLPYLGVGISYNAFLINTK